MSILQVLRRSQYSKELWSTQDFYSAIDAPSTRKYSVVDEPGTPKYSVCWQSTLQVLWNTRYYAGASTPRAMEYAVFSAINTPGTLTCSNFFGSKAAPGTPANSAFSVVNCCRYSCKLGIFGRRSSGYSGILGALDDSLSIFDRTVHTRDIRQAILQVL